MSVTSQDRRSRWQDIEEGLKFIQSTLPFHGTQEQYEEFIKALVRNLFAEGNDVFLEGEWAKSVELHTEALNIAEYAESEDIGTSQEIKEKLHANRAASYLNIGLHDQALEDCEKALQLNEGNYRALYRKARCLKELGKHQAAYDAVAKCSMAVPQDAHVIEMTQELAKMLGLKIRKPYVRSKPALNVLPGTSLSGAGNDKHSQSSASVEYIEMELGSSVQGLEGSVSMPVCSTVNENIEVESQPMVGVISPQIIPVESYNPEPVPLPMHMPLVNGTRHTDSYTTETRLDYDTDIIGDDLDELLDRASPPEPSLDIPTVDGPIPLPTSIAVSSSLQNPLLMPSHLSNPFMTVNLPAPYHKTISSYSFGLDTFSSPLDSLDNLSISESQTGPDKGFSQHHFMSLANSDMSVSSIPPIGMGFSTSDGPYAQHYPPQLDLAKNPLADSHDFKQACTSCYIKTGPGVLDYSYHPEDHKCKKDLLLGRRKHDELPTWKLIRPRPKNQYMGPFYVCKDVAIGEECKYLGHCTFAYCQEEIDVWTLERKGFICRDNLCDPHGPRPKINLTVPKILQEHHGIFMFLCEVCFDHKPRIISKTNKDNPGLCSHPVTKHAFEEKKCLVHILKDKTVKYSKIRPYHIAGQMDLCRHEVRYGCQREDSCFYAHSLIELKVWMMQSEQGISHENIVLESQKYWNMNAAPQELPATLRRFGPPNLKMQFVCGQCWRNGQVIEPDKNKKYCSAKARHPWSKERRVVLISSVERKKWTTVRSLPTKKPVPLQFEICMHVAAGKKCQYIGNCTFAHSTEERDLWTFMKENNISDMEQLYEMWLQSQRPGWSEETFNSSLRENGKQIHMPTDYAEEVAGNHCWLCGKNCNSDKQWQQHITSEKHKERVFNSEDDQSCWQYRFPTGTFKVCERFLKVTCTEGELCKLAHGEEELKEWRDRREFLLMKLAKARKDHLIAPNDDDFGKYSFLLKDIM
ncbi:zinc finger CCCH domain-containing protein 7A [Triplophysa rosa]|uniref:Zinc finger CCCH domain-containing protein 7A n=1 Tax=Triplophysa rosa TaxID=992332 RepID=A0A9W7TVI1_TRIRA|nr:zinc finger CCCH domain-containing protein 7A [Triplophysa rosa]KAI7803819.1 zinc finger CCCH domain-containing protein 7A [Triplophysa rosa]